MLRRFLLTLLIAMAAALASASQAAASYPTFPCTADNVGTVYTAPDGEVWVCDLVALPDWTDYHWVPLQPRTDPSDAVVYKPQVVTDSQGVQYRILSRLEWIGYKLYGGADFLMRTGPGAWYTAPTATIGHKLRAYSWDAATSSWSICRETAWIGNNAPGIGLADTTAWGNTPCGTRWYYLVGWVERQINGTWTMITAPQGLSTFGGTTLSGTTPEGSPSASNGMIWDPEPGDTTKPPKPPKSPKKLAKQSAPKAAAPVETSAFTPF